jgi:hypothetical protein
MSTISKAEARAKQHLLPPPRQGIIERLAEAIARLRRPKGKSIVAGARRTCADWSGAGSSILAHQIKGDFAQECEVMGGRGIMNVRQLG